MVNLVATSLKVGVVTSKPLGYQVWFVCFFVFVKFFWDKFWSNPSYLTQLFDLGRAHIYIYIWIWNTILHMFIVSQLPTTDCPTLYWITQVTLQPCSFFSATCFLLKRWWYFNSIHFHSVVPKQIYFIGIFTIFVWFQPMMPLGVSSDFHHSLPSLGWMGCLCFCCLLVFFNGEKAKFLDQELWVTWWCWWWWLGPGWLGGDVGDVFLDPWPGRVGGGWIKKPGTHVGKSWCGDWKSFDFSMPF